MKRKKKTKHFQAIGIYEIRNLKNNKVYIGSSINIDARWKQHVCDLDANRHGNKHLQRAWNKYGAKTFKFSILEECNTKEETVIRENWYLENVSCEYNIAKDAAKPLLGSTWSDTNREKRKTNKFYAQYIPQRIIVEYQRITGKRAGYKMIKDVEKEFENIRRLIATEDFDGADKSFEKLRKKYNLR